MQAAIQDHDLAAPVFQGPLRLIHHHAVSRFHHNLVGLTPVAPSGLAVDEVFGDVVTDKEHVQEWGSEIKYTIVMKLSRLEAWIYSQHSFCISFTCTVRAILRML